MAATGTLIFTLGASVAAMAQTSSDLSEIVVTAKNRVERLQDVPLAITALTNDTLKQADIRDSRDLQQLTPSLNMSIGQGRNDPTALSLRGIAPNTSDERYQAISFFIDGVALSGQLSSLDLSQIERVEIIKGPQSASFGRATYSGAINYITKTPSGDRISGSVTGRFGGNKGGSEANYFGSGYVSVPIIKERLWGSLEGTAQQQGGPVKAVNNGRPIGRERTQSVAGSLFWQPRSNFSVKLRSAYNHDRDTVTLNVIEHPRDWLVAGAPTVVLSRASGSFFTTRVPDPDYNVIGDRSQNIDSWLPGGGYERKRYFTSLLATYSLSGFELSYRGSYFYNRDVRAGGSIARSETADPIFGPLVRGGQVALGTPFLPGSSLVSIERFVNFSHQLLLLSPSDRRLRYKAGLYYFSETDLNNFSIFKNAANPNGQFRGLETLSNAAVFGSIDFDITDRLTFSGEGRYQSEKVGQQACLSCGSRALVDRNFQADDFLPRATLSYKITPTNMVYALYSYGVKSGRTSAVTIAGAPTLLYANPEKLDNYEIGSKNVFLDGRLVLNVAAYEEQVRDQQLQATQDVATPTGGVISLSFTNNVGRSRVRGFEAEASWKATDRWTFGGGAGYTDQQFTTKAPILLSTGTTIFFPGVAGAPVVLDGKTQANVPAWNGFVSAEYVQPDIWRAFSFGARLSGSYHGRFYADLNNIVEVPGAWTLNGRLRLFTDTMEVALFGRNLTNDRTPTSAGFVGNTATCGFIERNTAQFGSNQQCLSVSSQRPTEYGVEMSKRF